MTTPAPTWKVSSQIEATEPDQAGQLVSGYRVYFTTGGGQAGSVFVPMAVYTNVDAVKELISNQVTAVHAIANLNG
jgi:hypothetical protein